MIHPPRTIAYIVVHTCGAYDPKRKRVVHQSMEEVRAYHTRAVRDGGKGWNDIGYHRYIESDGRNRAGRLDQVPGAHVEGFNAHSLGICVSGHGDYEAFNAQQLGTLIEQCAAWCRLYELDASRVIGHREADDFGAPKVWKTCPGMIVDLDLIRGPSLAGNVGEGMPEA